MTERCPDCEGMLAFEPRRGFNSEDLPIMVYVPKCSYCGWQGKPPRGQRLDEG